MWYCFTVSLHVRCTRHTLLHHVTTHTMYILTLCHCVAVSLHVQCTWHTLLLYVITHTTYATHSCARFHYTYWQCVTVSRCHYMHNVLDTLVCTMWLRIEYTWHAFMHDVISHTRTVSLCHYAYNVLDTLCDYTHNTHNTLLCTIYYTYGVATNSRLLETISLFCRIVSFL